ncbi:MAG: VWA domain-containing protein [Candidatus Acidiferrum sp.]
MKSLRKIALLVFIWPCLVGLNPAQGQNPAPLPSNPVPKSPPPGLEPRSQGTISTTTAIVVVPVTVKDSKGNLVADLKRDEFRVFEDGVEQQIQRLNTDAMPISMVILIDNDLKSKDEQQVEPSLVSIVGGMAPNDEAFICRYDQYFHQGKGFTTDQEALVTQLRRTELASRTSAPPPGDPFGGPTINNVPAPGAPMSTANPSLQAIQAQSDIALDDAVYSAALLMKDRDQRKRRKIILLISDGRNGAKFNTHKYDEVREELLRQGITVYCVATGTEFFNRKFTRLVSYSQDTGGDVYYGANQDAFSEFYSRITEEARNQYVLIYSPRGSDAKVDYHKIEVRVKREGLTVLARQGYYGGSFAVPPSK